MPDIGPLLPRPAPSTAPGPDPLSVRGGPDGVAAALESLEAAARTLHGAGLVVADAGLAVVASGSGALGTAVAGSPLHASTALDPVGAVRVQETGLRAFDGPDGARAVAASLRLLADALTAVVRTYRGADSFVSGCWAGLVDDAGAVLLPPPLRPLARHALGAAVPGLLDLLPHAVGGQGGAPGSGSVVGRAGLRALDLAVAHGALALAAVTVGGPGTRPRELFARASATARAGGLLGGTRTTVREIGVGAGVGSGVAAAARAAGAAGPLDLPTTPAAGVGGLVRTTEYLTGGAGHGDEDASGRVLVQRISRPGQPTVTVVAIPGTRTWTHGGPDPMDAASDLEAAAGERTAAQDAVERALAAAGVGREEPLLLVGHSQGGMTAAALAADPAFRERFHPVAVLTAGSPVSDDHVPEGVAVLSLEHDDDAVPALDGRADRATPRHVTVSAPTPEGFGVHEHEGYARTGDSVDAAHLPALATWRGVVAPFLVQGADDPATTTTTLWDVRRAG